VGNKRLQTKLEGGVIVPYSKIKMGVARPAASLDDGDRDALSAGDSTEAK
jgi:hypothetical protein